MNADIAKSILEAYSPKTFVNVIQKKKNETAQELTLYIAAVKPIVFMLSVLIVIDVMPLH